MTPKLPNTAVVERRLAHQRDLLAVASLLSKSPATGRESFDLMVEAGVLEATQADALKPAVGLRNILVHMYTDIDLGVVAGSTVAFEANFSGYVRSVARWLLDNTYDKGL